MIVYIVHIYEKKKTKSKISLKHKNVDCFWQKTISKTKLKQTTFKLKCKKNVTLKFRTELSKKNNIRTYTCVAEK
jgi:hypothetical protein